MHDLMHDVRQSARSLLADRTVSGAIVLTLALGMAAAAGVIVMVNGALLRPLPYAAPEKLVLLWSLDPDYAAQHADASARDATMTVSPRDYSAMKAAVNSLSGLAANNVWFPVVQTEETAEQVVGGVVTPDFFDVLGVRPVLGTEFTDVHDDPGNNRVVMLAYGYWQRRFGGSASVVGSTMRINDEAYTILGVLPAAYRHPDPHRPLNVVDVFAPLTFDPAQTGRFLRVFGRLAPNATLAAAQKEVSLLASQLASADAAHNTNVGARIVSLREQFFGTLRPALLLLLAAAGLIMIIVSANVANLVLARGEKRRREFALRTVLGAHTERLVRLLLTESLLLALAGAALGLAFVALLLPVLRTLTAAYIPAITEISVDLRVIGLMLALAFIVSLGFGLGPLVDARRLDLRQTLLDGQRTTGTRTARRTRSILVVTETGLAVTLLVMATLLLRSLGNLLSMPTGFHAQHALLIDAIAPRSAYPEPRDAGALHARVEARLAALPGIAAVGIVDDPPLDGGDHSTALERVSAPVPEAERPYIEFRSVSPGYFEAMGIALMRGRTFATSDGFEAPRVVLVSHALADRIWQGTDPVGDQVRAGNTTATVIGVVDDAIDETYRRRPEPLLYFPAAQRPARQMTYVLRADAAAALGNSVRAAMREVDPRLALARTRTLEHALNLPLATERVSVRIGLFFSLLATALAAIGVYAVAAFGVAARTREIGIRAAVGARPNDLLRMVLADVLRLALLGSAAGCALAIAGARLIRSLLFGVSGLDLPPLLAALVTITVTVMLAAWIPARRAAAVHPLEALRD